MKFTGSTLFYYLATAGVASGVAATTTIGDKVGAGGENTMSFSLSYANPDGSVCTPCAICEGSTLNNVFKTKAASLCISCTDDAACDEAIITTSFKTAWRMTYASLSSHVGDNTYDPESIIILGSNNYDEGSKIGSWTILTTTSSDLLFSKRNEAQDIVVDNVALLTHYRFVFRRKDNSSPMKIGHVGVVESYLKMFLVELFETVTGSQVVRPTAAPTSKPTSKPTAAPTYLEFTNESLKVAVGEWIANRPSALQKYGEMKYWSTSKVTSMNELFLNQNTFNDDLTHWDTSNTTSMQSMFSGANLFNGDVSQWQTGKITSMEKMFKYALVFNNNIGNWDVSSVTQLERMFHYAKQFNQNISNWDTHSVVDMDHMFNSAQAFNIDVSQWNIAKVTTMAYMFTGTPGFSKQICWVTSGKDTTHMFKDSNGGNRCAPV